MSRLVALTAQTHGAYRVKKDHMITYAAPQHMMPLRVTEVCNAIINFPVFLSRVSANGDMAISALTSFVPEKNLFVSDGKWTAGFKPTVMQTYPAYLMRDEAGGPDPIVGIDSESPAITQDEGEPLFDGKTPSIWLSQVKARLLEDAKNMVHTFAFFDMIKPLDLIRPVDIIVNYQDGAPNRINGLNMVHEEKLQDLDPKTFAELRDKGYLAPIYAMLFSTHQLNTLIQRNNAAGDLPIITNINLEVAKTNRAI